MSAGAPASGPCVLCAKALTAASYCHGCKAFVCWTHRMEFKSQRAGPISAHKHVAEQEGSR